MQTIKSPSDESSRALSLVSEVAKFLLIVIAALFAAATFMNINRMRDSMSERIDVELREGGPNGKIIGRTSYVDTSRQKYITTITLISIAAALLSLVTATFDTLVGKDISMSSSLLIATGLLAITLLCIVFAIRYAPRKLFISTGAAVAFVLAAFLFEAAILTISFIETQSAS